MDWPSILPWLGFNLFVLALLALDLGVFHRKAHAVSFREAAIWSAVWIALALAFGAGVWHFQGAERGLEFLTGYLVEKSLSVDNLFVFALIFGYFAVPAELQHRVLFWGILGALALRAAFIAAGAALLAHFHWTLWIFGAFLVFTGLRMAFAREEAFEPERNPVVRLVRRLFRVADGWRGARFFVRENGRLAATPLFVVLALVEASDVLFAVDSIPAIFSITADPFLVYTSNVFAILGLRSLYFLLAGLVEKFVYLKPALAAILVFVGVKMLAADVVHLPALASLAVIAAILAVAAAASLLRSRFRSGRPGAVR